ncbi:glycosyltransferase [Desulfolutivibrio sulfoxidireducens]|uniref:glycosyltransferase n=1 Tax=Desulfolutivibrio sulfoxidireducens TaxID=2773299 RepID=UPI00159E214E|nr:glycosyltransferase [Desulfolutivibrio sulfoxidireducens]QLA21048.1 glycosyltransferase [Desulfolutivibrio sulfoxidireducens]
MRIDLHVHSKHSTRPSQWFLQKLGCPESFTEPVRLYDIAKSRGMDMVTIADHNTIHGALEIAHLPDAFISEEITSYFPEDRCKVHVLALDINESIHADIQKVRENVFELVPYLREKGVAHVVAHPLYGVNDRLTVGHFEKMLLLFENFEVNGTRDAFQNDILSAVLAGLTSEDMERLAVKHDLEPVFEAPWIKRLTGGSDDHSSLNIASMYTEVPGATNLEEFLRGLRGGLARPGGRPSHPKAMAINLYAIAYQFYKSKFGFHKYVDKDLFLKFVDRFLSGNPEEKTGMVFRARTFLSGMARGGSPKPGGSLNDLFRGKAEELIHEDRRFLDQARRGIGRDVCLEEEWFRFVTRVSDKVLSHFTKNLLDQVSGANLFDIFQCVGSAGALYTVLGPYFVAYTVFTKDRGFCRRVAERFGAAIPGEAGRGLARDRGPGKKDRRTRMAHFTDTFSEVNGVALTLRMHLDMAGKHGKRLTIITCGQEGDMPGEGVMNFKAVGEYHLEEYPSQKFSYPPFLDMLEYVYEQGFTLLHSATPGPIGLAALVIARILKLPIHATYHTAIPQYARFLTGDDSMEELMWRFVVWYYNQMDAVFVPSASTGEELKAHGVAPEKIRTYPRGVDVDRFHPAKRNGFLAKRGIGDGVSLLYVGRVSREKNLHHLAEAFRGLSARRDGVNLVVVGDGPYLEEMRELMSGTRCHFTGCLDGEDLAEAFASSDLFVFPSTTDTFGNVVLEAQASGLPVVVSDQGGPCENVAHGVTGVVVPDMDAQNLEAVLDRLVADPGRIREMGAAARASMEGRSFDAAFLGAWELYKQAS